MWWEKTWIYTTHFTGISTYTNRPVTAVTASLRTMLIFDGIKSGASLWLNGHWLGDATSQFLRYTYDISAMVRIPATADNELRVVFPALQETPTPLYSRWISQHKHSLTLTLQADNTTGINCEGRWMASSGGWDWSPYFNEQDNRKQKLGSKGIWKHVYIVTTTDLLVHSVVPVVYHVGKVLYPSSVLHYGHPS